MRNIGLVPLFLSSKRGAVFLKLGRNSCLGLGLSMLLSVDCFSAEKKETSESETNSSCRIILIYYKITRNTAVIQIYLYVVKTHQGILSFLNNERKLC